MNDIEFEYLFNEYEGRKNKNGFVKYDYAAEERDEYLYEKILEGNENEDGEFDEKLLLYYNTTRRSMMSEKEIETEEKEKLEVANELKRIQREKKLERISNIK